MTLAGTAARVLLGVVLLVAGVSKARDLPAWARSAERFGAPPSVARALPWAEVVLGALLVVQLGVPWVPLAALGLLGAFTGSVVAHVLRGDAVPCSCFGSVSAAPVSWRTVARNGALMALAVAATVPR